MKAVSLTILVALFLLPSNAGAEDTAWNFSIAPYLWVPNITGTIRYQNPSLTSESLDVEVGADDYLKHLDMAFFLAAAVRRARWVAWTDLAYFDLSGQSSSVESVEFTVGRVPVGAGYDAGSESAMRGLVWSLDAGYEVVMSDHGTLVVFAGFRYFGIDATTDWQLTTTVSHPGGTETFPKTGSASGDADIWDALVGVRGRFVIGKSAWFVPYHLDVGTGSSDVTWQGYLGVAYAFGSVDLSFLYRHLYFGTGGDDALVQGLSFSGPAFGAVFRF